MSSGQCYLSRSIFEKSALFVSVFLLSACAMPLGLSSSAPAAGAPATTHPPSSHRTGRHADVLLFAGAASWRSEIESLENILLEHGATYQEITSLQLDALSLDELLDYSLLIIPGGDAPTLTASLSAATHARLREAVQKGGLNYLGFCAGAWAAIAPAPAPDGDVSYGLGIVDGPIQKPNYLSEEGREFAISRAIFPGGKRRDLLWYGGPVTPELPGGVIVRYADWSPAVTQINSGQGYVIVSGLHPAATEPILNALGINDPEAIDPEFAWQLLDAGIRRSPLPAF